jgi:hypothetical protein
MVRCGKRHAVNSVAESWTGIGVVAGFCAVVLIRQWPHVRNGQTHGKIELLHILHSLSGICKTRNQFSHIALHACLEVAFIEPTNDVGLVEVFGT